jgi:pimeloyl-ACP methyl ester carboxylesterase
VLRYDERGCGLSDRDVADVSFDARVADLEAVIDAAGIERFALLGMSQGGPAAVVFAARHPERSVASSPTYARGRLMRDPSPSEREHAQLMISLIRMGWGQGLPAFRRLYSTLFMPDASPEQMEWFDELQRVTTDAETAVRIREARDHDEVTGEATRVASPTLVMHARDDALVPFAEGRLLATLIPGARFVALDSRNHILLAEEPAWAQVRGSQRTTSSFSRPRGWTDRPRSRPCSSGPPGWRWRRPSRWSRRARRPVRWPAHRRAWSRLVQARLRRDWNALR